MWNENTGETILCRYCDAEWDCPHLVLIYEGTNCDCEAGYACDRFYDLYESLIKGITRIIKAGAAPQRILDDIEMIAFDEIFDYAKDSFSNYGEADLDFIFVINTFIEALMENGGEYDSGVSGSGIVGSGCSYSVIRASDPKELYEETTSQWKEIFSLPGDEKIL